MDERPVTGDEPRPSDRDGVPPPDGAAPRGGASRGPLIAGIVVAVVALGAVLLGAGFAVAAAWREHRVQTHPLRAVPAGMSVRVVVTPIDDPKPVRGASFGGERTWLVRASLREYHHGSTVVRGGGAVVILATAASVSAMIRSASGGLVVWLWALMPCFAGWRTWHSRGPVLHATCHRQQGDVGEGAAAADEEPAGKMR